MPSKRKSAKRKKSLTDAKNAVSTEPVSDILSSKRKKRSNKRRKTNASKAQSTNGSGSVKSRAKPGSSVSKLSKLQQKFKRQLQGAQFRWINEQLYTSDSPAAVRLMKLHPEKFEMYHQGFAEQVLKWPSNPVKVIAGILKQRKKKRLVVVDFGCGDAELARTIMMQHKVHSFDLVARNELVTACDMANVPLPNTSADVAIFCLSLMGTNLRDFLAEANRVLRVGGELLVAEVKSRFADRATNSSSDTGIKAFVTALQPMHFKLQRKDTGNTMFVLLRFRKVKSKAMVPKQINWQFKACVYKRR